MKQCSQAELDAFVARMISDDGDRAKPMTLKQADNYLSVVVDLYWPDIPVGFTVDDFLESWNE